MIAASHGAFKKSTEVVIYIQRCLVVTWLVPRAIVAISAHIMLPYYTLMHQFTVLIYLSTQGACAFSCENYATCTLGIMTRIFSVRATAETQG